MPDAQHRNTCFNCGEPQWSWWQYLLAALVFGTAAVVVFALFALGFVTLLALLDGQRMSPVP